MFSIKSIGLMSGSSLDGLDIAYCHFSFENDKWTYKIICSKTISYSNELTLELASTKNMLAFDLMKLDKKLGVFSAESINSFLSENNINSEDIDLIASHGHTIFHQPQNGFTTQIGCGATINALTKIKTICDFRSTDVALHGQGAPLVPIGDELLFEEFDACLNLGGIANISFKESNIRKAYDISFANLPLNYICSKYFNCAYDKEGHLGKTGEIDLNLMTKLSQLPFYSKSNPKSLGREDFEQEILPALSGIKPENILTTFYEHFTNEIAQNLKPFKTILITGGGYIIHILSN